MRKRTLFVPPHWEPDPIYEMLCKRNNAFADAMEKKHNLSARGMRLETYLRNKAKKNSKARFKTKAKMREELAKLLNRGRVKDKRDRTFEMYGRWEITFDANVAKLNMFYRLDLIKLIKREMRSKNNFTVLEVGAGVGAAAEDIVREIPAINYIATGLSRVPEWEAQPHSKDITWKVLHSNQIRRKFRPNSIDFIHSNLGISYAPNRNIIAALVQCREVLRKGGKILFTTEAQIRIPKGFKKIFFSPSERGVGDDYMQNVYLLEKVI